MHRIEYLVVDTSAFIKNAQLQEIGNNVVTIEDVVSEIKSKRQLKRLVVLPYDLIIKDVFPENIAIITEFSKKTGDYPSLSATDIKVLALTYQLEKQHVGSDHLREEPVCAKSVEYTDHALLKPTDIAGFYCPKQGELGSEEEGESGEKDDAKTNRKEKLDEGRGEELEELEEGDLSLNFKNICVTEKIDNNESETSESKDEDGGWITPSNIVQAKKNMIKGLDEDKPVTVACLTTDFAMQNVVKQMGLTAVTLDGMSIEEMRTYILRCYACFKTTSIMNKVFCPNCGNKTLKRVGVTVNRQGKQELHINLKRPLSSRGKRFSLPMPQGGKHAINPVLCEDQRVPHQRLTKLARTKTNALDPDYIAGYSPFVMRDVNSKSAVLGLQRRGEFKYWMRKNPNEVAKNRKKK